MHFFCTEKPFFLKKVKQALEQSLEQRLQCSQQLGVCAYSHKHTISKDQAKNVVKVGIHTYRKCGEGFKFFGTNDVELLGQLWRLFSACHIRRRTQPQ